MAIFSQKRECTVWCVFLRSIQQARGRHLLYPVMWTMDMAIKLLASSKREGESFSAIVAPMLLSKNHPLCNVNDVFNAVFVRGNMLGDAMFYGSGAGKLPTASAVVADVVDAAKHLHRNVVTRWESNTLELVPNADAREDSSSEFMEKNLHSNPVWAKCSDKLNLSTQMMSRENLLSQAR